MINIIDKEKCCGCSACESICPKQCISMEFDEEGFAYPKVNKDICINCGLCEKICPVIRNEYTKDVKVEAYVSYVNDYETRIKSSSGGLFSVFVEKILKDNGVVFGAAFDDKFLVHHIGITDIKDLVLFQGSKYLQSNIGDSYKKAKGFLDEGRKVLFSGTACQIAALKAFLGKEYTNLFTIDVLCHGVPSPKVWERYVKEKESEYNSSSKKIEFRDKTEGWKKFSVKIDFKDSKSYRENLNTDDYMKLFLRNICLRPSCHDCKFKSLNRPSDITLGDCWGIEKYMPDMDDDKGTSVVLVHSESGQKMLNSLKDKITLREAEMDKALPPTADSRKSVKPHPNRKKFFNKFNKGASISSLVRLTEPSFIKKCIRKAKRIIAGTGKKHSR